MTTIPDLIQYVERLSGHCLNRDEGLQHGAGERVISAATVAWMATPEAIRAAGESGHELLIAHESLFYPYDVVNRVTPPADWRDWPVNRQIHHLLEQYGLSFLRLHFSVDEISIYDEFAALLGLGQPVRCSGLAKVYEIPPTPVAVLLEQVKVQTGMDHVRAALLGDPQRLVQRVGLPWGGMGLSANVAYMQELVAQGCDVFIAGETDNYGFRFAAGCGIPMIETSHEVSENPGLARFTRMLAQQFTDVDYAFYENRRIWETM